MQPGSSLQAGRAAICGTQAPQPVVLQLGMPSLVAPTDLSASRGSANLRQCLPCGGFSCGLIFRAWHYQGWSLVLHSDLTSFVPHPTPVFTSAVLDTNLLASCFSITKSWVILHEASLHRISFPEHLKHHGGQERAVLVGEAVYLEEASILHHISWLSHLPLHLRLVEAGGRSQARAVEHVALQRMVLERSRIMFERRYPPHTLAYVQEHTSSDQTESEMASSGRKPVLSSTSRIFDTLLDSGAYWLALCQLLQC